jgi:PAS domain S-box-containing protein
MPRFFRSRRASPSVGPSSDTQSPLNPKQEQFRVLVEDCPDGILFHREGVVLYVNPAGARLWGARNPGELVGEAVLDLVNPASRDVTRERIAALYDGRRFGVLEQQIIRRDGTTVDVESSAVLITLDGKPAVQAVVRDISERKRKERDLLALQEQLAAEAIDMAWIHELSLRLSSHRNLEWVLREVLGAIVALQNAHAGVLMLFDPKLQELYTVASIGFGDEYLDQVGRVPVGAGACGAAIERGSSVIVDDVETDPLFAPDRDAARTGDYRAVYSYPFFSRSGKPLGTIATYFRERRSPSEREIRLIERFAEQAAQFIENARLYEQTQQALQTRDEILAIVSHDLRNPVGLISMCADLLLDESYPAEKRRRQAEVIKHSAPG